MANASRPTTDTTAPSEHGRNVEFRRTTCNRDCPDACGIVARVEDGRITKLSGDPEHPITQGFLCYRTNHFLGRQYAADRLTQPLLRKQGELQPVPWEEALSFCAEKLSAIRAEHGPAAVFNYRSGGSLGLLLKLTDYFWELWGPVTTKRGDICGGAGNAAQELDFGVSDSSAPELLEQSKHVLLWGKNVITSGPHLVPILKRAKQAGAKLMLIDPVSQTSAKLCDTVVKPRPGGDFALCMAAARILFERGWIPADAAEYIAGIPEFRTLCESKTLEEWCNEADISVAEAELIASALHEGPTASLIGWGLGRRTAGGAAVRAIDALSALSGNLGVPGGGASFYYRRRAAFDDGLITGASARTIPEPLFGSGILEASDPPIRAVWVTAGNPVAMLPDSETTRRALQGLDLLVVCDSFLTDTAALADVVLPTPTLLEADDLVGAYGHHYVSSAVPVVAPPGDVKSDLEIIQLLAAHFSATHPQIQAQMAGTPREWKERFLGPGLRRAGVDLDTLDRSAVVNPEAPSVLFADRRFATASGKVELIRELPVQAPPLSPRFPLRLMALSTPRAQSSQWATKPELPLEARIHPETASGFTDGAVVDLESAHGSMPVRLVFDPDQRKDVALLPKGGHLAWNASANALITAQLTDLGEGGVLYDEPVGLRPRTPSSTP
ncbi:MAG: molybdopterin-dependent oxidoreductase [Polyangiaceae bacterium]|nr:molybdopterin-dependent oxidoreductase [Polyangiaceae bacterium]